ncbi:MAG: hypothetical protein ABIK79_11850 [Chloroflexota bacterium]
MLWRWKWVVVVVMTVTIAVVSVGSAGVTPQYSASTTVRIAQSKDGSIPYGAQESV